MSDLYQNKYRIQSARKPDWDYGSDAAYFITICVAEMRHAFGEIVDGVLVPTRLGEIADALWWEIPTRFPYALLDEFVVMPNHLHGILVIDKMSLAATVVAPPTTAAGGNVVETRFIASLQEPPSAQDAPITIPPNAQMPPPTTAAGGNVVETRSIASLQEPSAQDAPITIPPNAQMPPPETAADDPIVETRFIASLQQPRQQQPPSAQDAPIITASTTGGITGDMNPMLHENLSRILRWYKGRCAFEMRKINPKFDWQARFHDHIIRNEDSLQRIRHYIRNNPSTWNDDRFYGASYPV